MRAVGILLVLWFAPMLAAAQDASWLVVVASTAGEDPGAARRVARSAAAHLHDRGHVTVEGRSLETRLRERLSVSRPQVSTSLVQRVTSAVDPTLSLVATRDADQVRRLVEPILDDVAAEIAALGLDDTATVALSNLCLFLVRAELEAGRADEARRVAGRCFALVPDVDAERLFYRGTQPMHPGPVRALITEVRRSASTTLVVEAPDSEGQACRVRLQGRVVADQVPATINVVPGSYALQVECAGAESRVRYVEAQGNRTRALVDARLDSALVGSSELGLVYASGNARDARLPSDVALLAARLEIGNVLIVSTAGGSSIRVARWSSSSDAMQSEELPLDAAERVPAAVDSLLGRERPSLIPTTSRERADEESGGPPIPAFALIAAGAIALGVATYGFIVAGDCTSDECAGRYELASPAIWLWTAGGVAGVGAGVLWLAVGSGSEDEPPPTSTRLGVRVGGTF